MQWSQTEVSSSLESFSFKDEGDEEEEDQEVIRISP